MTTKDDQEAVAAWMESLGFERTKSGDPLEGVCWFKRTMPLLSQEDATFFYQALKQWEDEAFKRGRIAEAKLWASFGRHGNAAIDAAFGKNKEV